MTSFDLKERRDHLWSTLAIVAQKDPFPAGEFSDLLKQLYLVDRFWGYPGRAVLFRLSKYFHEEQFSRLRQLIENCCCVLQSGSYRKQIFSPYQTVLESLDRPALREVTQLKSASLPEGKPYFEVLIIHPLPDEYELMYRQQMISCKSLHDEFLYEIVLVASAEDALTAVLANPDIAACVYLSGVPPSSALSAETYAEFSKPLVDGTPPLHPEDTVEENLCRTIRCIRPDLDHYLISAFKTTELPINFRSKFDRILYLSNPFQDLHAAILNGVRNRFSTPFFDALRAYSRQPKGVFHALPLSRGASVTNSPWIRDLLDFYGDNIFLAETSSTQGGLDSLLDPTGAILQAHVKAAETFGADSSFFVTNGTSTSNKIVMQATLRPGDIVLISSDSHKSIPYSVMLAGALPIFLDTYPLEEYDLYGGIDVAQIKAVMLELKKHNKLDRLKQITLTNSTFDGLIHHSENFMMEILAIKPDIIFHWDEAWFAFAHFHPLYFRRSAMSAVGKIRQRLQNPEYLAFHAAWAADFEANTNEEKWFQTLYPDPAKVQLRVYVTQSTHKTLTAFRQGSMIHVADACFDMPGFLDAFRIHTSTSPNYQIIASLDVGRRQCSLEGFHMVREAIRLSMQLRRRVRESELLRRYFSILEAEDLIPDRYRKGYRPAGPRKSNSDAGLAYGNQRGELAALSEGWGESEFVIDPTRVTLCVGRAGFDGSSFRQLLMTRYDIQVNKTSRNTVLFLMNIGATQATVDYLIQVLNEVAALCREEDIAKKGVRVDREPVALPGKRIFHRAFLSIPDVNYPASNLREAYFLGTNHGNVEYLPLSAESIKQVQSGRVCVSASFVTPYPPGFPILVPGQVITSEILQFFEHMKIREIHGFSFELGFKVLRNECLD